MSGVLRALLSNTELPDNEANRLVALEKYRILDTEDEKDFNDIVQLVSQICNTPVAVITIIDTNRQWFKAKTGWNYKETDRKIAFCSHTIQQDDILVIADALIDNRFCKNPLVLEEPQVRFYAGMPLTMADGYKLGTLAVVDFEPRSLTEQQLFSLRILARQVVTLLELRLQNIKLAESNFTEKYRQIVETAQEGIWVINEHGNTTFVNEHMAIMLGYEKEEMIGMHLFEFMDEENKVIARLHLERRKLGINEQHDFVFQTRDKHSIITSLKTNSIFEEGIYKGALAMVMDVTQRRRAEEKVILSERRFRALIENSLDGLTVLGQDGIVLDMSPSAKRILGYDPKEIIGQFRVDLIFEEDQSKMFEAFEKAKALPHTFPRIQYRHIMPDGSLKWIEGVFNNLLEEPSVKAVVLNYRDINDRKKYEQELLKANDRFKLITRATNDVVWDWDLITNEVWWNENYFSLFEYNKAVVKPTIHSWYDGIHPDDKDRVIERVHTAIKEGQYFWVDEYRFVKSDGTYLNIYDRAYLLYDAEGRPYRIIGAMMDISPRKMAEDKLKTQFEELQKKNYELDRFVYSVSHDLRAPLASILGLIHIAEMEVLTPDVKKFLELMQCSVSRLDDFIGEILDYSLNSRIEVTFEKINFNELIAATLNRVKGLAGADRLKINVEVKDRIDFYSDASRIKILLNNLLTNSILFQDEHKESYVSISVKTNYNLTIISVRDNGIGIEKKFIDKIFNMFYKASVMSTGSGLGLYIVKEIVTKLGGTVSANSEYGKWTEFEIILPNSGAPEMVNH
jgi:PAS domain S-box-containing protein